jgi:transketolase
VTKSYDKAQLSEIARKARIDVIKMISGAASGHPGGSLSLIEMVVALYTTEMKHDPSDTCMVDRDRFVLSKGHGIPAVYAVMAQLGYWDREKPMSLRTLDSPFQGHPDRCRLPGMEASTGSLGQGLSIAVGLAMASRMDENSIRTYCIIGDGESQEGQVWEAAMCAPKYKLDNLVCFIDNNKVQLDGFVADIMPIEPIADKWKAFGWHVISIDGHDFDQIFAALDEARATKGKPTFIIADTVKGKGVSFMENKVDWHGVAPTAEQAEAAILELENRS